MATASKPASTVPTPATALGFVTSRFPLAAHVTVGTARREPRFEDPVLASEVFELLRRHPRTLAAVVLPDHVHWLLRGGWDLAEEVGRLKRSAVRRVAAAGAGQPLWQPSFFDTPVESEPVARMSAAHLLANPVVSGLAQRWQDYPWAHLDHSLGG